MGRIYLKVLRVVLRNPEGATLKQTQRIAQEFAEKVNVKILDVKQVCRMLEQSDQEERVVDDRDKMQKNKEAVLWLTDCADVAERLSKSKLAVMAWLHEGNRNCFFANIRYAIEDPAEAEVRFYDNIYRRFAGIPWEIAETERCIIRETTVEDVDEFIRIYREPEITRYTDPFCGEPDSERQYVKEYIEKIYEFFGYGVWTVLCKETGEVIGRVGFEQPVESDERGGSDMPVLGYMIALPWQGKGIAKEVCEAVLSFARQELGFSAVQVTIDADNTASLKLAEKLGFEGRYILSEKGTRVFKGVLECQQKCV